MNLFENIQKFGDTFYGIRKHENYFIIDLKFPSHWAYEGLYDKDKIAIKVNTNSTEGCLASFYCGYALESVKFLENELLRIIKFNKDKEEKDKLLQAKTRELEELFQSKNLEELKNIDFNVKLSPLPNLNKSSNGTDKPKDKVVKSTDRERQSTNPETQK